MRISDWSSDVCSSDLSGGQVGDSGVLFSGAGAEFPATDTLKKLGDMVVHFGKLTHGAIKIGDLVEMKVDGDRKSVVKGKSVSVRVDLGGRGIIKKKK